MKKSAPADIIGKTHLNTYTVLHFAVKITRLSAELYNQIEVISMYRRIRELREDHDLTQREMAEILHCSQQVYSNYELGQRDIPTDVLKRLALFHDVSADYILELTDTAEARR